MEYVIGALAAKGVRELVVVVGYQKERIMDYFGDGVQYGVEIEYVVQDEQLGTADALSKVESRVDGPLLVVNGDNLVDETAVEDILLAEGENVILAALREHAGDYGVLTVEGAKVTKILEKPGRPVQASSTRESTGSALRSSTSCPGHRYLREVLMS